MEVLVLWKSWYCGSLGTVEVLVLWKSRYCGSLGTVEVLVLWKSRYCGSLGTVEVLVLWKSWYCVHTNPAFGGLASTSEQLHWMRYGISVLDERWT
ncbi:hypothetical protein BgiMline_015417 [Biomphalaria glabrata]